MSKPKIIAIEHDDHHASHIGSLPDGRQFFLTTPFVPAMDSEAGREFVALFLFDKRGSFLEARIDDMGVPAVYSSSGSQSLDRLSMVVFKSSRLRWSGSARPLGSFPAQSRRATMSGPWRYSPGITWRFSSLGTAETMILESQTKW
jgi:hypothetical protein